MSLTCSRSLDIRHEFTSLGNHIPSRSCGLVSQPLEGHPFEKGRFLSQIATSGVYVCTLTRSGGISQFRCASCRGTISEENVLPTSLALPHINRFTGDFGKIAFAEPLLTSRSRFGCGPVLAIRRDAVSKSGLSDDPALFFHDLPIVFRLDSSVVPALPEGYPVSAEDTCAAPSCVRITFTPWH